MPEDRTYIMVHTRFPAQPAAATAPGPWTPSRLGLAEWRAAAAAVGLVGPPASTLNEWASLHWQFSLLRLR